MSDAVIRPRPLRGAVTPPPSKSVLHRAVVCASLAKGKSAVRPYVPSDDIDATVLAMRALGAEIRAENESLLIDGSPIFGRPGAEIDCRESGSTLRFLLPVAAAGGVNAAFTGRGRLPERPLGPYLQLLPEHGVSCAPQSAERALPLRISGRLAPGEFALPGNISSQFVTGLLFALPLLPEDSVVRLTTPVESAGYIDLTLDILSTFGISLKGTQDGFSVPGGQRYKSCDFVAEGDWSQAAFWLSAGALGGEARCFGLSSSSRQGDRAIVPLLRRFGADIREENGAVTARGGELRGIDIDAAQIPDLVPVLAAVAAFARGRTRITRAGRLRLKESDRLRATARSLAALGARVSETEDGLIIEGAPSLPGGAAESFGDHRIAMALAVAAGRCSGAVTIRGSGCVAKSYPRFFEDYKALGGDVHVIDVG